MASEKLQVVDLLWSGDSLRVSWQNEPGTAVRELDVATRDETETLAAAVADAERQVQDGATPAVMQAAQATLGRRLFALLDGPERALARRQADALRSGQALNLVVRLRVGAGASLAKHPAARWRWEHLASECGALVLDPNVRLGVQFGEFVPRDGGLLRVQPKLRMVFMACSAQNVEPVLDFEREEELIADALSEFVSEGKVSLRVIEEGTLERLRARLMHDPYDVVHLTGHGVLTDEGPRLVMEDAIGGRKDVSAADLLEVFQDAREKPYLVVISSCWSAGTRGDLPSLAARLVEGGVPSVIGWARPVRDDVATKAARNLYERLCVGESVMQATAHARQRMHDDDMKRLLPSHAWGTLQLLTREAPGPRLQLTADGAVEEVPSEVLYRMLGRTMRVLDHGFVGRRRELQRLVRMLREGKEGRQPFAGAVVTGMKGQGKSCLVARAIERHFQDVGGGAAVALVLHGTLGDSAVLDAFRERAIAWGDNEAEKLLDDSSRRAAGRVERLLLGRWRTRRMVIVLDDFEANLDIRGEGLASLQPEAAELLEAIIPACLTARPKLLVTSTARFALPTKLEGSLAEMDLGAIDDASVRKLWLRGQESGELAHVLPGRWRALAERLGRNARVLEWARQLLGGRTPREVDDIVKRASERLDWKGRTPDDAEQTRLATIFLRHLSLDEAKAKVGADALAFVQRARVYEIPVPQEAFTALVEGLSINLDRHVTALANLGLLEAGNDKGVRLYRVSPLVEKNFNAAEGERWHREAARYFRSAAKIEEGFRLDAVQQAWRHALAAADQETADWAAAWLWFWMDDRGVFAESAVMAGRHVARFPESVEGALWEGYATFRAGELQAGRAKLLHAEELAERQKVGAATRTRVCDAVARVLLACGDHRGAEQRLRGLVSEATAAAPGGSWAEAIWLHELAKVQVEQGDLRGARASLERSLEIKRRAQWADKQPDVASSLQTLGAVLLKQGALSEARAALEESLAIQRKVLEHEEHPEVALILDGLAAVLLAQRDLRGARSTLERSLEIKRKMLGTEAHLSVASTLHELARVLHAQHDLSGARENLEQAQKLLRGLLGTEEHMIVAALLHTFAGVLQEQGDLPGARVRLERSLEIKRTVLGTEEHAEVATSLHELATVREAEGKPEEAMALYRRALQVRERVFGTRDHYQTAETEVALGNLLAQHSRAEEGESLLQHAMRVLSEQVPDHPLLAQLRDLFDVSEMISPPELAEMALRARATREAPPREFSEELTHMREAGPPYDGIADFLDAIARGDEPPGVPEGSPEQIRTFLASVAEAAQPRARAVDLRVLVRAARSEAPPPEFADWLSFLRRAGPPNDAVADYLDAIARRGELPTLPEELPEDVRAFLSSAAEVAVTSR